MAHRKTDLSTVAEALANPDAIVLSEKGRLNAWKQFDGEWVRVTFRDTLSHREVITAVRRRKGPPTKLAGEEPIP